jgi:hypothetical protein
MTYFMAIQIYKHFHVSIAGRCSFWTSICFFTLNDFVFASINCPVSKSLSSGQFPPKFVNYIFWLVYCFCFSSKASTKLFKPVSSRGIYPFSSIFAFGFSKKNTISVTFYVTNGIDHENKSMKFGSKYG